MKKLAFVSLILIALISHSHNADSADGADAAQDARLRELSLQLRCLVCQNQSINDSDSDFAQDVRQVINTQIGAGKSDDEIIAFLRLRYGDYILFDPPFTAGTAFLWIAPILFLVCGIAGVVIAKRANRQSEARNAKAKKSKTKKSKTKKSKAEK